MSIKINVLDGFLEVSQLMLKLVYTECTLNPVWFIILQTYYCMKINVPFHITWSMSFLDVNFSYIYQSWV